MTPAGRRLDVDWLRISAVYLLFPFHVGKVFDVAPFYQLKNAELSEAMGFFTGFVHQWHMRLLFPLAGCFVLCPFLGWAERLNGMLITGQPSSRANRSAWPVAPISA